MTPKALHKWYKTPLGHAARRAIQQVLDPLLADLTGKHILVIGYGLPYLDLWAKQAQVFCAMAGQSGALSWPRGNGRTTLAWDDSQPFCDQQFDATLLIHSLEHTPNPGALLSECNRILKHDGKLVLVSPNRSSLWARGDHTPFGSGRPYSADQLGTLLSHAAFQITAQQNALIFPPLTRLTPYAGRLEQLGQKLGFGFGGVTILSASKDILSGTLVPGHTALRSRLVSAEPAGARYQR